MGIYHKYSEAAHAAFLSCIGKQSDLIRNRAIGNEALGPVQDISTFCLFRMTGYSTCIGSGTWFSKCKGRHAPVIQRITPCLLLFFITPDKNWERSQRVSRTYRSYTGTSHSQLFCHHSYGENIQSGTAVFLWNSQGCHAGLFQNPHQSFRNDSALIYSQRSRLDFFLRNSACQINYFFLLRGNRKIHGKPPFTYANQFTALYHI